MTATAVAARPAGCRGVTAFAQFAALLPQERPGTAGAFFSPSRKRCTAPTVTAFHSILADLPPDTLDGAIGAWTARQAGADTPLAMDGRDIRGASKRTADGRRMTVAAAGHGSGMALRQAGAGERSNGIPAVRGLAGGLDIAGRTVTMDAMHARHGTARCLPGPGAGCAVTAVRDSQETVRDGLRAIDFAGAPSHGTVGKGHGRIERRHCAAAGLSGAERDGCVALHGRRQAIRTGREQRDPQDRRAQPRDDLAPHPARSRTRRTRGASRPGAQPLDHREPGPLRTRLHLRRGPVQGLRAIFRAASPA